MRNEVLLFRGNEERNIQHTIKRRKTNWIGHILRRNCLQKHVIKGKIEGSDGEGDEEDVSSCWMTLRKREDTEIPKRKHSIALCGELSFEGDKRPVLGQTKRWCE